MPVLRWPSQRRRIMRFTRLVVVPLALYFATPASAAEPPTIVPHSSTPTVVAAAAPVAAGGGETSTQTAGQPAPPVTLVSPPPEKFKPWITHLNFGFVAVGYTGAVGDKPATAVTM